MATKFFWGLITFLFGYALTRLLVRGVCRDYRESVSDRCVLAELAGGAFALFCRNRYGDSWRGVTILLFLCILTAISLIDICTMEIPDRLNLLLLLAGIVSLFTMPAVPWGERAAGCLVVSAPMFLLSFMFSGGFGGGDIKLMFASGAFMGWKYNLASAVIAMYAGGIYGVSLLARKRAGWGSHFAFGPFLCFGLAFILLAEMTG